MENMHESHIKAMGKRWFNFELIEVSKTHVFLMNFSMILGTKHFRAKFCVGFRENLHES